MDRQFAETFAADWIDSWNAHDLDRILSHYSDDFSMSSPKIAQIAGEPSGTLRGKNEVRAYWAEALQRIPDLHFELLSVLTGVNSLVLYYRSADGRFAAETFHFDTEKQVTQAFAHYG